MTPYFYLYSILSAVAPLSSAQDLKIDFSCHADFNQDSMNNLKDDCRLKTTNPLKRPCVDGCILNDLGLMASVFNSSKYRDNGYGSGITTTVSVELEDLLSDNQDLAEAIQKSVEEKCGDLMRQIIHHEKKTCEEWDPIYSCVQEVICATSVETIDQIFPNFKCYHGYKRGPAREDHELCMKEIEQPFNKGCYKACMLQRFGIFEYSMAEGEPVSKLGDIGSEEDGYYGSLVSELQWRLKGNEDLSIALGLGIHEKCGPIFQKTVVEEKKSCEEWDPFYDCIKDVVGCK